MSSVSATIQQVFNEPGCAKNANKTEAERKKGCTKQLQPGGAAGGCALDGAQTALPPPTDLAPLVRGPSEAQAPQNTSTPAPPPAPAPSTAPRSRSSP